MPSGSFRSGYDLPESFDHLVFGSSSEPFTSDGMVLQYHRRRHVPRLLDVMCPFDIMCGMVSSATKGCRGSSQESDEESEPDYVPRSPLDLKSDSKTYPVRSCVLASSCAVSYLFECVCVARRVRVRVRASVHAVAHTHAKTHSKCAHAHTCAYIPVVQERGPELAEASLADGREAKVPDLPDGLLWEVYREDGPCWDPLEQLSNTNALSRQTSVDLLFNTSAPLSRQTSADLFKVSSIAAG